MTLDLVLGRFGFDSPVVSVGKSSTDFLVDDLVVTLLCVRDSGSSGFGALRRGELAASN